MKFKTHPEAETEVTIDALFIFDPWPFKEESIRATLGFLDGNHHHPHHPLGSECFLLSAADDNAIAILSDGRRAVCNPNLSPIGTTVTDV